MRVNWIGNKDETLACLAIFTIIGAVLGFFMSTGYSSLLVTTALGASAGIVFWSLFAMQDLRVSKRHSNTCL